MGSKGTSAYTSISVHSCIPLYTYKHGHIYVCAHVHMYTTSLHTCNCIHTFTDVHAHGVYLAQIYTCRYIQIYMCRQTHVIIVMQVCVCANSCVIRHICTRNTTRAACTCVQMWVHIHTDNIYIGMYTYTHVFSKVIFDISLHLCWLDACVVSDKF